MNALVNLRLLQLSGLLGLVLPMVISLIKQDRLSRRVNSVISALVCVLAATVLCEAQGQLSLHNVVGSFAAVFIASAAAYHQFFGPTGVDSQLSSATDFLKSHVPVVTVTIPSNVAVSVPVVVAPVEAVPPTAPPVA